MTAAELARAALRAYEDAHCPPLDRRRVRAAVAAACKIKPTHLSAIKTGRKGASPWVLAKLAEIAIAKREIAVAKREEEAP